MVQAAGNGDPAGAAAAAAMAASMASTASQGSAQDLVASGGNDPAIQQALLIPAVPGPLSSAPMLESPLPGPALAPLVGPSGSAVAAAPPFQVAVTPSGRLHTQAWPAACRGLASRRDTAPLQMASLANITLQRKCT